MPWQSHEPQFTVDLSERPPTCFPTGVDMGELRNISTITDRWAKFIRVRTGEVVDCAFYAKQAQMSVNLSEDDVEPKW